MIDYITDNWLWLLFGALLIVMFIIVVRFKGGKTSASTNTVIRWYLNHKNARQWTLNLIGIAIIFWATQSLAIWLKPTLTADMLYTSAVVGPQSVKAEAATSGSLEKRVRYTGKVVPIIETKIAARIDGYIEALKVYPGDKVKKNQELARIEISELNPRLEKAKINKKYWQRELTRDTELFKEGAIDESQLDITKKKYGVAKAELDLIETEIGYAIIRAPHDGYIAHRKFYEGDFVRKGQPLLKIVSLNQVRLQFDIAEQDLTQIKPGTNVYLSFPQISDNLISEKFTGIAEFEEFEDGSSDERKTTIRATVNRVFPEENLKTHTGVVEIVLANPESILRANTYVVGEFVTQKIEKGILIPSQAIVQIDNEKQVIYIAPAFSDEGDVEMRPINILFEGQGFVSVGDVVTEGEFVVTQGNRNIVDGETVRVIKRKGGF